jgi:hypothetical protein
MRTTSVLLCVAFAAIVTAAGAVDDKRLIKGPPLGDEKYTVHLAGMANDVVAALSKKTGRQIYLQIGRPEGGNAGPDKGPAVTPVTLDYDDTPLDVILTALCRQAGLVYTVQDWNRSISLREGDPDIDSRPTADAGDYIVRAISSTFSLNRSYELGWGAVVPESSRVNQSLSIGLEIAGKTPDADLRLAGVDSAVTASTDKGGALTATARGWGPDASFIPVRRGDMGWGGPGFGGPMPMLQFAAPPAGVRALTKVQGSLRVFTVVKVTDVKLKPGVEAQPVTVDDVAVTVRLWKQEGDITRVGLEVVAPSVSKRARDYYFSDRRVFTLVAKDGRKRRGMVTSSGSTDGTYKTEVRFDPRYNEWGFVDAPQLPAPGGAAPAAFEPDYLLFSFTRYGDPDKSVPFVLENVPVP